MEAYTIKDIIKLGLFCVLSKDDIILNRKGFLLFLFAISQTPSEYKVTHAQRFCEEGHPCPLNQSTPLFLSMCVSQTHNNVSITENEGKSTKAVIRLATHTIHPSHLAGDDSSAFRFHMSYALYSNSKEGKLCELETHNGLEGMPEGTEIVAYSKSSEPR